MENEVWGVFFYREDTDKDMKWVNRTSFYDNPADAMIAGVNRLKLFTESNRIKDIKDIRLEKLENNPRAEE